MKHPFQNIASTKTHLFTTVKNNLQVFKISDGSLVGNWVDTVDSLEVKKKQHEAKFSNKADKGEKSEKSDSNEISDSAPKRAETNVQTKIPKFPVPGPGAPPIYNYIRCLQLTDDEAHLIGTTDSDKAIIIFKIDFNNENCLTLIKRQAFPKRPCSISVADNNKTAIIGDKFGDVYKIGIDSEPAVEEKTLKPILGHVSMLTDVLVAENNGKQYLLTSDRDEHIKVSHYPQTYVVKHWLFGHDEFISSMIFPPNKNLLVTGGGDDSIFLWNWIDNQLLSTVNLRDHVEKYLTDAHYPPERFRNESSPKEISVVKLVRVENRVIVLLENVKCLISLIIEDEKTLQIEKVLDLSAPLVDISLSDKTIIGASDSDKLIRLFDTADLHEVENDVLATINAANPCDVASRDECYPLYNMNYLRKRSEH